MGHQAGGDIANWIQNALREERREIDRLLAQRHENLLQQLHRQLPTPPTQRAVEAPSGGCFTCAGGSNAEISEVPAHHCDHKHGVNEDKSASVVCAASHDEHEAASLGGAHLPPPDMQPSESTFSQMWRRTPQQEEVLKWLTWLDILSGIVILLNLFVSALETQYNGFDLECLVYEEIGCKSAKQVWPGMREVFSTMEMVFGIFFTIELFVRIAFFVKVRKDLWWNVMDALFIIAWFVEIIHGTLGFNPTMLRMVRLIRLMRLMRLVAHYHIFHPLFLITKAVQSSMSVLVWTALLLFLLMMAVGMMIAIILEGFISDPEGDENAQKRVFASWGGFLRAYVSMFEITLANWGPQCWLLMNDVHVAWGIFFIVWRCCFGFAVIQVITAVFIQHTFKVASRDEDIMIKEKEKASSTYLKHLDTLFTDLDESGDGKITQEEFNMVLVQPRFRHFFGALEIDVSDVPRVFQMLDNGDGEVTKDEFIDGLKKLKGNAQAIDMFAVAKEIQRLKASLKTWDHTVAI